MKSVREKVAIAVLTGVITGVSSSYIFGGSNVYASELKAPVKVEQSNLQNGQAKEKVKNVEGKDLKDSQNKDIKNESNKTITSKENNKDKKVEAKNKENIKKEVSKSQVASDKKENKSNDINKVNKAAVSQDKTKETKKVENKGWKKVKNTWYYYDNNGKIEKGWLDYKGHKYYLSKIDGSMVTGALAIDGKQYYFNQSGELTQKTGWLKGKDVETGRDCWYYFDKNGTLQNGLKNIDGETYYFNEAGIMETGAQNVKEKDGTYKLMMFKDNGALVRKTGWYKFEYKIEYDGEGVCWYYVNSDYTLATGAKEIGNHLYYFDKDQGVMITDEKEEVTLKNGTKESYYFDENGIGLPNGTGWTYRGNGSNREWTYLKNGQPLSGLQNINGKTYLIDPETGVMRTGVVDTNKGVFCFDENGARVEKTGWNKFDGKWYYLNNDYTVKTGWLKYHNNWYYLNQDEDLTKGKSSNIYGTMVDSYKNIDGKNYLFNRDGSWVSKEGWKKIEFDGINQWTYINSNGELAKGWEKINNKYYYFDDYGFMAKGTVVSGKIDYNSKNNKIYFLNEDGTWNNKEGWHSWNETDIGKQWCYLGKDGLAKVGWQKINGNWYYFDLNNGAMDTGLSNIFENGTKKTEYFTNNGAWIEHQSEGWKKDNRGWYYVNKDGKEAKGWEKISGKWYYFDEGYMVTGIKKIYDNNTRKDVLYAFDSNGALTTKEGWYKKPSYSKDFYFWGYVKADGEVATGWEKINGNWYFFDDYGMMQVGTFLAKNSNGESQLYYADMNGALDETNGWHSWTDGSSKNWCYVSNGKVVTGNKIIDGTSYYFDQSGTLID